MLLNFLVAIVLELMYVLLEASSLYIEESALTGESVPVQKKVEALQGQDVSIGDQKNMAFMGTMITRGSGTGVVVATGMNTAMGQIANMLQNAEQMETPLQRRLEQLGKNINYCGSYFDSACRVSWCVSRGMKYIICF